MQIKRGFTLIELLVVIAIIGLLATIITGSLSSSRSKGRDARRVSDIKTIQLALENYYNDNLMYPKNIYTNCSGCAAPLNGLAPNYLAAVPTDAGGSTAASACASNGAAAGCYSYKAYSTNGVCTAASPPVRYHIGAVLEQTNNGALINDADAPTAGNGVMANYVGCTNAGSSDFDGTSPVTASTLCTATGGVAAGQSGSTETCYDWIN